VVDKPVFYGIDPTIRHMVGVIQFIADVVFPIPPLPNPVFSPRGVAFTARRWGRLRETRAVVTLRGGLFLLWPIVTKPLTTFI
jgi:hypothetical protein